MWLSHLNNQHEVEASVHCALALLESFLARQQQDVLGLEFQLLARYQVLLFQVRFLQV